MLTVTFWVFTGIFLSLAPTIAKLAPPSTVPLSPPYVVFVKNVLVPLKSEELGLSAGKSTT